MIPTVSRKNIVHPNNRMTLYYPRNNPARRVFYVIGNFNEFSYYIKNRPHISVCSLFFSTFFFCYAIICMPFTLVWLSNIRYPTLGIVVIYSGSNGDLSIFFRIFVILTRSILLFCSAYGPHIFSKSIWYVTTVPAFNARLSMIRYSTGEK